MSQKKPTSKPRNNLTGILVIGALIVIAAGALYALVGGGGGQIAYGVIDVQQAHELINSNQQNDNFIILDVRTQQEVDAGVVQHDGANFTVIDFYDSNFNDEIAQLDKEKTYVIYCRTGSRSGQTYDRMKELGFDKIYNIQGGISAWQQAGLPVDVLE